MNSAAIAFYATAATVIPVLFLALTIQGRSYENLLKTADETASRWEQLIRGPGKLHHRGARYTAAIGAAALAVLMLVYGAGGEIAAIVSLAMPPPPSGSKGFVTQAVVGLTVITAVTPAIAFGRFLVNLARGLWQMARDMSEPPAGSLAVTGKTDSGEGGSRPPSAAG